MSSTAEPLRLAVLVSGSGTTLQNLLDRCADGRLPAEVVLVIASRADAFGLERARKAGVPAVVVDRKDAGSLEEFSRRIFAPLPGGAGRPGVHGGFLAAGAGAG